MRSKFALLLAAAMVAGAALQAEASTYYASPNGNDKYAGTQAKPWRTLQRAKKSLKPGDTLLIADGDYPGGVHHNVPGLPGKPITYKAINPGKVILHGEQAPVGVNDDFVVMLSDWVVVDGLVCQNGVRDGIWVASSCNVVVRNCVARNNGVTGIFTSYSDDLLIENNECYGNQEQHGIYFSNSGDRPVIRGNVCHDNGRCGIQLNGDGKQLMPKLGTRGDGIINQATLDRNVCYNNGQFAGAAINLMSVRNGLISNNLVYNNLLGGISFYNDNRPTATQWGCKNNMVAGNTVYFRPTEGRWCMSFTNGSAGNIVQDNILYGGARGAYQYDHSSPFAANHNLVYSPKCRYMAADTDSNKFLTATEYQDVSGNDLNSIFSDPLFVAKDAASPDFHLQANSPGRQAGVATQGLTSDADGIRLSPTRMPDIGCYGAGAAANASL